MEVDHKRIIAPARSRWDGTVLIRGGGMYDVRSTKRYRRRGS